MKKKKEKLKKMYAGLQHGRTQLYTARQRIGAYVSRWELKKYEEKKRNKRGKIAGDKLLASVRKMESKKYLILGPKQIQII
jgi:hypothetical protein